MFSLKDVSDFPEARLYDVVIYDDYSLSLAHAAGLIGLSQQTFTMRYGNFAHKNPNPKLYKGHNNRPIKWCISLENFSKVLKAEEWSPDTIQNAMDQLYQAVEKITRDEEDEPALPARKRSQEVAAEKVEKRVKPTKTLPLEKATLAEKVNALTIKVDELGDALISKFNEMSANKNAQTLYDQLQHRPDFKQAWGALLKRMENEERIKMQRALVSEHEAAWRAQVEREFKQDYALKLKNQNSLPEGEVWVQSLFSDLK